MSEAVEIRVLGSVPYEEAVALQSTLAAERANGSRPDTLLLLEHPSTYTRGRRASDEELPRDDEWYASRGISIHQTDRGGQVTWHGPGQIVAYPIVDLSRYDDDVHLFVRKLETSMVDVLDGFGVAAGVVEGLTGVWTGQPDLFDRTSENPEVIEAVAEGSMRKIGSIGIHVRGGITTHGFAINLECDLEPFGWIVPCGIEGCRVTSVMDETGTSPGMETAFAEVAASWCRALERIPTEPLASDQSPNAVVSGAHG